MNQHISIKHRQGWLFARWYLLILTVLSLVLFGLWRLIYTAHEHLFSTLVQISILLAVISWQLARYHISRQQSDIDRSNSEALFRGLLDSAPDAIVIVNTMGHIVLVNKQTELWFGYSRDELLGQPIELLVPGRFHERHRGYRDAYIANPILRPMGAGADLSGLRKDGSEFPLEISLSPLVTQQETLVSSIIRDISVRKQTEQAKLEAQSQYQELVNNLPIGIYRRTSGTNGIFLEVNPEMLAMFDADSAGQLLGQAIVNFYSSAEHCAAISDRILQQGFVNDEESPMVSLRGRPFYASISAVLKHDKAGNSYFYGVIEDISKRKEAEQVIQQLNASLRNRALELESINRELEAFSYSVSHDLRAPLRAVDGFSRILLDEYADRLDEKGRDRLNRVRAAAQHMSSLIDDLLQLSRITRTELKQSTVDLSGLAAEVLDELQKNDPQRTVNCLIQPAITAQGDVKLLRIALVNLLGNAWKFTSKCSAAQIEFGIAAHNHTRAYFVRDNGAGFNMAYAEKLFSAFQRLHSTSEFPGTGIGLATVQRIIHKHAGRIWANSEVGQGACFYFTLEAKEDL